MSLMLKYLPDRILRVSEFIEPAKLFVFNLLCIHCITSEESQELEVNIKAKNQK